VVSSAAQYRIAVGEVPEWVERRLDTVAARLFAEYRRQTRVPEPRLRAVIDEARDRYGAGCVREFAPIVIERAIRDELAGLGIGPGRAVGARFPNGGVIKSEVHLLAHPGRPVPDARLRVATMIERITVWNEITGASVAA